MAIATVIAVLIQAYAVFATECRSGFERGPLTKKCYILMGLPHKDNAVMSKRLTFFEAQIVCRNMGARLAIVETAAELKAVQHILQNAVKVHKVIERVWIDGMDVAAPRNKNEFYTANGAKLAQLPDQWAAGEPNNFGNNENCIGLFQPTNYKMNDQDCFTPNPYICEIPDEQECDPL